LTRLDELRERGLGQACTLALVPQSRCERELHLDEARLLVRRPQEVSSGSNLPSGSFERRSPGIGIGEFNDFDFFSLSVLFRCRF